MVRIKQMLYLGSPCLSFTEKKDGGGDGVHNVERLYARASNDIDRLPHPVISPGKHPFHLVHKSESNRTLLLVVHSGDELQLFLLCMLPIKNTVATAVSYGTYIYIHSKLEA